MRLLVIRFFILLGLLFPALASAATSFNLTAGWNLLGNSNATPIDVAATFGDAGKITTVWKWNKTASKWAFYAPSMTPSAMTAYAQGKGYDVLTSIDPKEGFWVNAKTAVSLTGPMANGVTLVESDLQQGWNLLSSAGNKTPSQLNQGLRGSLNAADKTIVTAWAWDAPNTKWKFYAPAAEAKGGTVLTDYITAKGYLPFSTALSALDGFWLNIGTVTDACVGATSKWALWTSGVTCLRGANIWQGPNISAYYMGALGADAVVPPFAQADFDALAAMGANVVRINYGGLFSETAPYALNQAAQNNLDNLLVMIKNANMFATLSFQSGPGLNENFNINNPQEKPWERHSVWDNKNGEQQAWVDMWKYIATYYKKDKPLLGSIVVGYDLMNEPHANELFTPPIYDPSQFYAFIAANPTYAPYDWNPLAKRISDAIRQVDTDTPILIPSMSYGSASWLDSLISNGDSKTVYVVHQYMPTAYTHQDLPITSASKIYGTTPGIDKQALQEQFDFISSFTNTRHVPVGIGEFGARRYEPNAAQCLIDEMQIMEDNGLNYNVWLWESSYPGIAWDDFNFRKGTTPDKIVNGVNVIPPDEPMPTNPLMTAIQKYFQKNAVRPSNRGF